MKKTIALVLAAMMLMTLLLSGCGDSKESSKVSTGATTGDTANVVPISLCKLGYFQRSKSDHVTLLLMNLWTWRKF